MPLAAGADEERHLRVPGDRDRGGDSRQCAAATAGSTGTTRSLPPLPMHPDRIAADAWRIAAVEPDRLGNAQARSVEKGEHGGVPRRDPRLLVERLVERRHVQRVCRRERPRQGLLLPRRSDGAKGGAVGEPVLLDEADQRADAGDAARDRARAGAVVAAIGEKRTDVGDTDRGDVGDRRRPAEMEGEKGEELPDVPVIGIDGLRREPPLVGQMPAPSRHPLDEIGRGNDERVGI